MVEAKPSQSDELKMSQQILEPQEGQKVCRVYWMRGEKAKFLEFADVEEAVDFYRHFSKEQMVLCMTGNKIIRWDAERREEANKLVDFIINDGFIQIQNQYALLWYSFNGDEELHTEFGDRETLELKYKYMWEENPKCLINRTEIIEKSHNEKFLISEFDRRIEKIGWDQIVSKILLL